jgi:GlpG protein
MRQAGTLSTEPEARRFAAWLVAQRIEAHAEAENGTWVIWVRDEDQLARAREALAHFREHPADSRYAGAEQSAEALQRDAEAKRRQAQGNVVEMRGRWGTPGGMPGMSRRSPLVLALIGLSALAAFMTYADTFSDHPNPNGYGEIYRLLTFVDPLVMSTPDGRLDEWASVRQGEVWRLVTPIFVHYGWPHIVFNMMVVYSFGASIEDRRGSLFMLLLVLALAVSSNVGQAIEVALRERGALFGGMSGVGYGLFGYLAIKARFDSRERYFLSPGTTFMALLWLGLCILRDIPPFSQMLEGAIPAIANTAHLVGLAVGAAIAYVPIMARKPA